MRKKDTENKLRKERCGSDFERTTGDSVRQAKWSFEGVIIHVNCQQPEQLTSANHLPPWVPTEN